MIKFVISRWFYIVIILICFCVPKEMHAETDYESIMLKYSAIQSLTDYKDKKSNTIGLERITIILDKLDKDGYFNMKNNQQRLGYIKSNSATYPELAIVALTETGFSKEFPILTITKQNAQSSLRSVQDTILKRTIAIGKILKQYDLENPNNSSFKLPYPSKEKWSKSDLATFYTYYPFFKNAGYSKRKDWTDAEREILMAHVELNRKMDEIGRQFNNDISKIPKDTLDLAVQTAIWEVGGAALKIGKVALEEYAATRVTQVTAEEAAVLVKTSKKPITNFVNKLRKLLFGTGKKAVNKVSKIIFAKTYYIPEMQFNKSWNFNNSSICGDCAQNTILTKLVTTIDHLFAPTNNTWLIKPLANHKNEASRILRDTKFYKKLPGANLFEQFTVVGQWQPSLKIIQMSDNSTLSEFLSKNKITQVEYSYWYQHEMFHGLSDVSVETAYYDHSGYLSYAQRYSLNDTRKYIPLHEGFTEYLTAKSGDGILDKTVYLNEVAVVRAIKYKMSSLYGENAALEKMADIYFNGPNHLVGLDEIFGTGFHDRIFQLIKQRDYEGAVSYINNIKLVK